MKKPLVIGLKVLAVLYVARVTVIVLEPTVNKIGREIQIRKFKKDFKSTAQEGESKDIVDSKNNLICKFVMTNGKVEVFRY